MLKILMLMCITIALLIFLVAATNSATSLNVSFAQQTYSVNESDGVVQIELVLSNKSSTDITVRVKTKNITANGECTNSNIDMNNKFIN